jgi:sulfotransferase
MKRLFFNSSMPRACSTLLQNVLNQNSDIYATGTDGSLELLYGARSNYTSSPEFKANDQTQMLKAWRGFCKGALHGYCDGLTDKSIVCIKSRGIGIHYKWYEAFLEESPKVICMVRNMKSIFSSMEKIYRSNQENHQNIQSHSNMTGTTTAKRVDIWANSQPVGLAIERLEQMFLEGIDKKVLFVRAEDLTSDPNTEMKRIYDYLQIESFNHDFKHVQQVTSEDDSVYGLTPTLHKIRSEIQPLKPDYIDILGINICNWIDDKYSWYQKRFYYNHR